MNFIYFICPENQQLAKYCEGFYNRLTYGYKYWNRDRYVTSTPKEKEAQSRLLINKNKPAFEEMRAGDPVLEKIYEKVITTDCYLHSYQQITVEEINNSKLVIYMTDTKSKKTHPSYLVTKYNNIITWKITNIKKLSNNKFNLLDSLIRKLAKPSN